MKLLFWKEWRETRLLPFLALATYISFLLGEISYERFDTGSWQQRPNLCIPLSVTLLIFWTVAGSCAISPEIGSGTLQFMSIIPIRRRTLWWVKLTSAVCSAAGVFAITAGFMLLLKLLVFPYSSVGFPWADHNSWSALYWLDVIQGISGLSLACIAFGICASPMFEQPIVSTVVAAIGGATYFQFWFLDKWGPIHRYQNYAHYLAYILVISILWIMPPLVTSYQTFVRGELLKSMKRYKIGTLTFIGTSVVSTVIYALLFNVS